jgi:hypothetical protein
MQYRLRTLLIALALGPPLLAWIVGRVKEGNVLNALPGIGNGVWGAAFIVVPAAFVAARVAGTITGKH